MRTSLLTLLLCGLSLSCFASDNFAKRERYFDQSGRFVGSARTYGNRTFYYGPSGLYQGQKVKSNGSIQKFK